VAKWDENKNNKSDLETPTERSPSGNTLTPSSNISSTTTTTSTDRRQQQHVAVEPWQSSCICKLKAHAASSKSLNCRQLTEVLLLHLGCSGVAVVLPGCCSCVTVAFWVWIALLRFVTDMRHREQQQQAQPAACGSIQFGTAKKITKIINQ